MASKEQESVQRRIAEFLFRHEPFSALSMDSLLELVKGSTLKYFGNGERIFNKGDALNNHLYVIRKGQVDILGNDEILIDQCAEGELFGARALLKDEMYKAAAVVKDEALVITLPAERIRKIMAQAPSVLQFFFGDFSSGVALRKRRLAEMYQKQSDDGLALFKEQVEILDLKKEPVTCSVQTTISDAAQTMRKERVGSIVVVNSENQPIGIITDTDLRNQVATGEINTDAQVELIMSKPVLCSAVGKSVNDYVLDLAQLGVHHLCITKTGNRNETLLGVITDHDILRARSNSAAVLLKSMKRAENLTDLKQLLQRLDLFMERQVEENESVRYLGRLMRLANQLVLEHTFRWAGEKLKTSIDQNHYCWLALGSVARSEQIIRTDFDAAMVVADDAEDQIPLLIKINNEVYRQLTELGFKEDPAGIQANNGEWVKTSNQWKQLFERWMQTPDENAQLNATIFFDLMPMLGQDALGEELQQFIQERFARNRSFEGFLSLNALKNPPPLGFFKHFILEKSGEHKDEFDLKLRAMMPIADAARLLALKSQTVYPSNTIERLERVAETVSIGKEVVEDAAAAYEIFLRARARSGFSQKTSGRYLNLNELTNFEKQVLKNAFDPLREIQHLIKPA